MPMFNGKTLFAVCGRTMMHLMSKWNEFFQSRLNVIPSVLDLSALILLQYKITPHLRIFINFKTPIVE